MSRGRRRLVKVLVFLGSILAFLSVFAIWVERQALSTDDWVTTSGKLLDDSTIRAAVADYLVDQLYENVDVQKELRNILPGETKQLSGPLSGGLRQVAGDGAEKVLETGTAKGLWEEANRTTHEQLVEVLNEEGDTVSTEGGDVTLNLGSLLTNLASQIGFGRDLAEKLPPDAGQIKILHSDDLKTAQNITTAIKGLALLLSILTFAAFAAAIYLARDQRWVTVLSCGVGLIAAGFAAIVARHIAGGIVLDQLVKEDSVRPAADATWSIATSLMTSIATTLIVVGILFAIAGWLASPNSAAKSVRRFLSPFLRLYPAYVYAALAIVICFYFISAPTQGLRAFLTTLIVAGMAAFGIHELRRQTAEEYPEATFDDVFGDTRERVRSAVKDANIGERVGEQASKLRLQERLSDVRERAAGGDGDDAGSEAPTAALPRAAEDTRIDRLERLGALREKGILTDEEFAAEKSRLLAG